MEEAIAFLVERITVLVIEHAAFLHGVEGEVNQLQIELKRMQSLLEDTYRQKDQNERVRNWISEIRDLAYDAEDVIDTFLLKIETTPRKGLRKKIVSFCTKVHLPQIRKQIKDIQDRVRNISESKPRYDIRFDEGFGSCRTGNQQQSRQTSPRFEDKHATSLDGMVRDVIDWLKIEEDELRLVSIAGMGGLGKTTLAKKVYNDIQVKQHFDCCSWASISQQFSTRDVLVGILADVASSKDKSKLDEMEVLSFKSEVKAKLDYQLMFESMKGMELIETLHGVLDEKRYLVVLDDIWTNEAWDFLKRAFPNGKRGSKVLFTTRHMEIASEADPRSLQIVPPFLTIDEGWKLLSGKAFSKDTLFQDRMLPFEKVGKELVKKCGGLPLAVVVIGGLLATKRSLNEWETVERNINAQLTKWELQHRDEGVYRILALSYDDLPFHLKRCFLYLSQFPKGNFFHKRAIIRMWIAEGFISQQIEERGETMEDVGEKYWKELVSRCMIQASQMDHTGIGAKTCSIHDLVREMCLTKAREENFFRIIEHQEHTAIASSSSNMQLTTSKSRRISIYPHISGLDRSEEESFYPLLKYIHPKLRSLTYFVERGMDYGMTRPQVIFVCNCFTLLRVLNVGGVNFCDGQLPREIGNLIHLRYLGLRGSKVNTSNKSILPLPFCQKKILPLPSSIGNLKSLYTLDVRNSDYRLRLPDVLWKLECLRHLLVDEARDFEHLQLHTLKHLETLKSVYAKNLTRKNAMQKLTNLRNLGIYFQKSEEVEEVMESTIFQSGRLQSLKMWILGSFTNLKALSRCKHLTKVELGGQIPDFYDQDSHNLNFLPTSLAKLILSDSELKQDPMGILKRLPNLRFLSLKNNSVERSKMVCSADGFRQLDILELHELSIQEWEIEEGAMPCLKTLSLASLKNLIMIPEGLKFITTLQELKLIDMSEIFKTRVQAIDGIEGEDFPKVRHIPSISFSG